MFSMLHMAQEQLSQFASLSWHNFGNQLQNTFPDNFQVSFKNIVRGKILQKVFKTCMIGIQVYLAKNECYNTTDLCLTL